MQRLSRAVLLAGASLTSLFSAPATALSQSVQLAAGGGVATDTRGVRSSVVSLAPSLVFAPSPTSWLTASATASRFGGSSALGGTVGAGGRAPVDGMPLAFTLSTGGSLTRASYGATFTQVEAVPGIEVHHRSFVASLNARAAAATSSVPVTLVGGPLGSPISRNADSSRSMLSAIVTGGVRGKLLENGSLLDAIYREERGNVSGVAIIDRSLGIALSGRSAVFTGGVGMRDARDDHSAFGNVGLTVGVATPMALQLAAGQYVSNRLTGVPGGSFASAGILLRFGSATPRAAPAPVARGVAEPEAGHTRLTIRAPKAKRVEVAGDWSEWRAVPARRAADGVWYVDLALEPGRYRYAFRVDGSTWTVPEGASAEDDGLGGRTAWLTVRRA